MTRKGLIGDCDKLRRHIEARGWASSEEIEDYYPKGGKSASKDAWWLYRGQLMRFMGRAEWHQSRKEEAEEEVLKALRDEPRVLTLASGEHVEVHPKGFEALLWFRDKDFTVEFLHTRITALRQAIDEGTLTPEQCPQPRKLLEDGEAELAHQIASLAYAACMEGPTVDREKAKNPPDSFINMHPLDLYRILDAYQEVNIKRLTPIPILLGPGDGNPKNKPMGWNVFFATSAKHYKVDVRTLMRDRSLVSLLAQVQLAQPTGMTG